MAASRTTRHGNGAGGAGWGGPAKGARRFTSETAAAAGAVSPGQGQRTVADLMAAAGARELAAQRWLEILNDPAHPKHAEMVAKAADRMDGAPKQDITSAGERIGYVITAPAEAEDADAWARQHQPR